MKNVRLTGISIRNFKGIKELDVEFSSGNTIISGYNGIGKTTIADAYNWLLFNKNVNGNTKFAVRPRDKERNEIHDIITSVECEFSVSEYIQVAADNEVKNEIVFKARKEQIEDMTKTERTSLKPETIAKKKHFYFIDNAPYPETEFGGLISQFLAPDGIFQLISNPLAFFAYDEKKQRELLFEACGSVANEKIKGYDVVSKICGAVNTPEKTRDSLSARLSDLRKQTEKIPERIDELSRLINLSTDYVSEREKVKVKYEQITAAIAVKKDELTEVMRKANEVQTIAMHITPPERPQKPNDFAVIAAQTDHNNTETREKQSSERIARLKGSEKSVNCPNCGHIVPVQDFTAEIARETSERIGIRAEMEMTAEVLLAEQGRYKSAVDGYGKEEAKYLIELQEYNEKMSAATKIDTSGIQRVQKELSELAESKTVTVAEGQAIKSKLEVIAQLDELKKKRFELDEQTAVALESLDAVKEFITRKANLEMEKINGRFKTVTFALFDMQTNGEYKDCCKAVVSGINFADTNFAKKIQSGIEVSALFAEHYGITAPIFVDNKESVFKIPEIDAQIIMLKAVDYPDKEFHFENLL